MKTSVVLIGIFLLLNTSAFGELTQSDIEKIQSIVEKSEKQIKEYIDLKINELDTRLSGEIKALNDRLDQIFTLTIALIAFIAVVVGVPQIIVAMQRKDIIEQGERIKMQQERIEALRHEIDEGKHEHIASS